MVRSHCDPATDEIEWLPPETTSAFGAQDRSDVGVPVWAPPDELLCKSTDALMNGIASSMGTETRFSGATEALLWAYDPARLSSRNAALREILNTQSCRRKSEPELIPERKPAARPKVTTVWSPAEWRILGCL
jgi:hypothetical protein